MIIVRNAGSIPQNLDSGQSGSVVTIGNFDGVHIGHQAMLEKAREQADALDLPLVVLSFDPHADAYFTPHKEPARLSSLGERVIQLSKLGVDTACIVPFNRALSKLGHDDFVKNILVKQLDARCVVIGDDFHYGNGRQGNHDSLITASKGYGFEVLQLDSVMLEGVRVSSTGIRELLSAGELDEAARFLGRRYSIMGRVTHGDARGRTWGFPTLNLPMFHTRALKGVYAVRVSGLSDRVFEGVANLGRRPTVGGVKNLLEIHVFNYNGNAYGQRVCVDFYTQIREEHKFDSFDALKAQIQRDISKAKSYFKRNEI